jgi:hypothetical protein
VDAKRAIRRAYFHVTERGLREVVDADLSDYFSTILHGALRRCLRRRIADGHMLSVIKQWLRVPVVECTEDGQRRTTEAADKNRGVRRRGPPMGKHAASRHGMASGLRMAALAGIVMGFRIGDVI